MGKSKATYFLSAADIAKERGAFFGSILATFNHILLADLFWLRRISSNKRCKEILLPLQNFAKPTSLRGILYDDMHNFSEQREALDTLMLNFADIWTETVLAENIRYRNMTGEKHVQPLGALLQHLFNHQTHHRGQITALLFQAGIDPKATDLIVMMMEEN